MAVIVVGVATVASYGVAWLLGIAWLVPVLNTLPAWIVMARTLRRGQVTRAIAVMLVWAATMAVSSTTMSAMGWSRSGSAAGDDLFLRSWYRDEMLVWVRTGQGAESDPGTFLPRHALHAGVFAAASAASGGVLSMPMGAVLTNSMGEYVGALAAQSARPVVSAVLAWHPWAVIRVVAFVLLGVLLSAWSLARADRRVFSLRPHRLWIAAAVVMLVLDVALKALLAPTWAVLLRETAGW